MLHIIPDMLHHVATIAPMKRIKGADSDRDSQYSGVVRGLGV